MTTETSQPKHVSKLIGPTLETLASLPVQVERPQPTSSNSAPPVGTPCRNEWQRKWLKLDCVHPKIQELADEAEAFAKRFYRRDLKSPTLLVMFGAPGCGKTHVLEAVYNFCNRAGFSAWEAGFWPFREGAPQSRLFRWPEICSERDAGQSWHLDSATTAGMLAIDDIGAEDDPFRKHVNILCQILSRRERKFTVVTTNIDPSAWKEKFDPRVDDRLLRNSVVVNLSAVESYSHR